MPIRFHRSHGRRQAPSRSGPDLAHPGSGRFHDRQVRATVRFVRDASSTGHRPPIRHARLRGALPAGLDRPIRIAVNLLGAADAALFACASVLSYLDTHRLIGGLFAVEQVWFVVAFLARRPQRAVSRCRHAHFAAQSGGWARVSEGAGLITDGNFGTRRPRGRSADCVRLPAAQEFGAGKRARRGAPAPHQCCGS